MFRLKVIYVAGFHLAVFSFFFFFFPVTQDAAKLLGTEVILFNGQSFILIEHTVDT